VIETTVPNLRRRYVYDGYRHTKSSPPLWLFFWSTSFSLIHSWIYNFFPQEQVDPSAQGVPRSAIKIYKRIWINNINKVTISCCPNTAIGSTTNDKS
jgi:hypothetical protein